MDAPTVTMDPAEARAHLEEYRDALRGRADDEFERAAEAYEALADGLPILRLSEAFKAAPEDELGRPRLAIARADRKEVYMERERHSLAFDARQGAGPFAGGQRTRTLNLSVPYSDRGVGTDVVKGWAMVPMIPPRCRPRGHGRGWFILWEVEEWADRSAFVQPDRDPLLLKSLGGSLELFAVLAEWDLTDVERLILAGGRS